MAIYFYMFSVSSKSEKNFTKNCFVKELFEKAVPFYEKAKELEPDNKQLWGQILLTMYWKLNSPKYGDLEKELGY